MGKLILYSPIGGTDPISKNRDGSLLHICRKLKPDVVYLMMSAEIIENHEKDNRYVYCIKKLEELLYPHKFEINVIQYRNLEDVNLFEPVYNCIVKDLEHIKSKMKPDDKLIVNVSSGTPAMKYCLQILSAISDFSFTPYIVSTPTKKMNHNVIEYNLDDQWNNNKDNQQDSSKENEERIAKADNNTFYAVLHKVSIIRFIQNYNYSAALELINMLNVDFYDDFKPFLEAANARFQRNIKGKEKVFENLGVKFPFDISDDRFNEFEYALVMGINLKHKEYNDFVRSITPLVTNLYIRVLKKSFNIDISKYLKTPHGSKLDWDAKKLIGTELLTILNYRFNGFKAGFVKNIDLVTIIKAKIAMENMKNSKLSNCIKIISKAEERLRNKAAHTLIAFSEKDIKSVTGYSATDIYDTILQLMSLVDIPIDDIASYDNMNKLLIEKLG